MRAVLALLLVGAGACVADEPDPPPAPDENVELAAPIDIPAALALDGNAAATSTTEAINPDDCTYIQWCNRPNSPEKIVCVTKAGACANTYCNSNNGRTQIVAACQNTARDVCGTSTGITYHGCNGLGPP